MAPCGECGYDVDTLDRNEIGRAIAELAGEHCLVLASIPAERLRDHSRPASWSALEYGCHVRDVLRFQRERIIRAQAGDTPEFASMRRDERAVEERYNDQDPEQVSAQIATAARQLTETLAGLDDVGWMRTGVYNWPERAVRTMEWLARLTVHELAHHLFDERRLVGSP